MPVWASGPLVDLMKLYRFLSDDDTALFCRRVTAAFDKGWVLHGNPAHAFDAATGVMRRGQAVVKDAPGTYSADVNLGAQ